MHINCVKIPAAITATGDEEKRRAAVGEWVEKLWQAKDARLDSVRESVN